MTSLEVHSFLEQSAGKCVVDVRSPHEFQAGHVPYATNIPLFLDHERAYIGTIYHKLGSRAAINAGFKITQNKLASLANQLLDCSNGKELFLYCWRGGMRSRSMAWLVAQYGVKTYLLYDGYKSFRRYVLDTLNQDFSLVILSGFTGTGKTDLLNDLAVIQEPVIDLEKLANHKGSAFGNLYSEPQPSQEYFENLLAYTIKNQLDRKYFWVEDESRTIGKVVIPKSFWDSMRQAPVVQVNASLEVRIQNLIHTYGNVGPEILIAAFQKIQKKLGPLASQKAIQAIQNQDITQACQIALHYYDKTYATGLKHRENMKTISIWIGKQPRKVFLQELIQAKNSLLSDVAV